MHWRQIYLSLALGCAIVCQLPQATAVVITTGNGSANTTPPPDDPGFANVGQRGGGSAIYLGNGWVLTASHVGAGAVDFGGIEYPNQVEATVKLPNPIELALDDEMADLLLLRLEQHPPLPALHLPCEPIALGSEVTMIGAGRDREAEQTHWKVNVGPGKDDDVWEKLSSSLGATKHGYETLESRSVRWGSNLVGRTKIEADSGFGEVRSFETSFSQSLPVDDLAQGVRGDSGGAVFQKNESVWELVGMMHAVGLEEQQPGATTTAIFGQETFVADLHAYQEILRAHADFEPAVGDVDGDGAYSIGDINVMQAAIREHDHSCHLDLNADQQVDVADRDALLVKAHSLVGDADLDGVVSFADFLSLSHAFSQPGGWESGDFDGDGEINFFDFLALSRQFGEQFTPPTEPLEMSGILPTLSDAAAVEGVAAVAVPEPSAAGLLGVSLFLLLAIRSGKPGKGSPRR